MKFLRLFPVLLLSALPTGFCEEPVDLEEIAEVWESVFANKQIRASGILVNYSDFAENDRHAKGDRERHPDAEVNLQPLPPSRFTVKAQDMPEICYEKVYSPRLSTWTREGRWDISESHHTETSNGRARMRVQTRWGLYGEANDMRQASINHVQQDFGDDPGDHVTEIRYLPIFFDGLQGNLGDQLRQWSKLREHNQPGKSGVYLSFHETPENLLQITLSQHHLLKEKFSLRPRTEVFCQIQQVVVDPGHAWALRRYTRMTKSGKQPVSILTWFIPEVFPAQPGEYTLPRRAITAFSHDEQLDSMARCEYDSFELVEREDPSVFRVELEPGWHVWDQRTGKSIEIGQIDKGQNLLETLADR